MIRYLKRNEIDDLLWDNCITHAANGLPYSYSWYLDAVADDWNALVLDNYQAVFPLPYRQKFGILYLYQPYFTQQLGVFSTVPLTAEMMGQMLDAIPSRFRFIEMNVNGASHCEHPDFKFASRTNLELPLKSLYADIKNGYKNNTRRNVSKALKSGLQLVENTELNLTIDLFKNETGKKIDTLKEKDYQVLQKLGDTLIEKGAGKIHSVIDQKKEIIASALFIYSGNRIINLLLAANAQGKALGATTFLFDLLIEQHAGSDKIFDFEGSMIPGIARFYSSFGAVEKPYWQLKRSKIPWYLKFYKR